MSGAKPEADSSLRHRKMPNMNDTDTNSHGALARDNTNDSGGNRHEPNAILHVLLDYLPSGVTLFGPDLEMIACNAKLRELLDFPDELFAHGLPSLPTLLRFNAMRGDYGPGDPEEITAAAVERARTMKAHVHERARPNGVALEIRGTPLPGGGFVTIYNDITERKQTEKALRDSEAELRLLTDNVPAMILYVDRNMHCVFANKHYADFFDLTVADIVGKPLREIVGKAAYPDLEGYFNKALEGHPVAYQRNVRIKSGAQQCIDVKLVPRVAEQGQIPGCYFMAIDITEQKQAEERIQHMAHHDSLTGLPNRLLFNDRLGQAISLAKRDARQFALLYLDLDKFKPVNDTLGHDAGDQLLKSVAERIRELVRESDTVARVGGDEFTVILRDVSNRQDVAAVARKIILALSAPFRLGNQSMTVEIGTSIGIAVYPSDSQDHQTLIKLADAAMYSAKTTGSSFRFFGI
jgi:diguanylate cyclase (GGDEF)-like protein/PAS domain S-box-containing protein